jgi:hypothetical protein
VPIDTAWARLRLRTLVPQEVPKTLYLSRNTKTDICINVPIVLTCRPTAACAGYCYGLYGGPIAFPLALARQTQNYLVFERLATAPRPEVDHEADRIGMLAEYEGADFIRMFGVGDFQVGSVRFVNALARRFKTLQIWVSTRRPELARKLVRRDNLHIMLSVDATTLARDLATMRSMVRRYAGQAFIAYVQTSADDVPIADASVVFAQHRAGGNRAPWTAVNADPRTCPATRIDGLDHRSACSACRHCFTTEKRVENRRSLPILL